MEKIKEIIIGNSEITEEEKVKLIKEIDRLKANQKDKRYGLVWENHPEDVELLRESHTYKVEELKELEIKEVEGQKPNLILEGDNLHSLEVLRDSGVKVDVIYIDPPYNTLNETGFAYNDKKVDSNDNFRHSKWLSFMEKRLKLARQLMTDDGVIFVSIDDNELYNLKLLMDQVFGEQNFISNVIVENNPKGRKNNSFISKTHEYCIVYARNKIETSKEGFNWVIDQEDKRRLFKDERGVYKQSKRQLMGCNSNPKVEKNTLHRFFVIVHEQNTGDVKIIDDCFKEVEGGFIYKETEEIKGFLQKGWVLYKPETKDGYLNEVTYTRETVEEMICKGDLIYKKDTIYQKDRENKQQLKSVMVKGNTGGLDILTETSNRELKELMGEEVFKHPKNINFIQKIIGLKDRDITVLDFFAGSGTTGHAVMELNKEDGGNRRFILCTNNEYQESKKVDIIHKHTDVVIDTKKNGEPSVKGKEQLKDFEGTEEYQELVERGLFEEIGICRAVTYERNKRVIQGYTTPKGKEVKGLPNNLKYYKVGLTPKEDISELSYLEYNAERMEKELEIKEGITSFEDKGLYSTSETKDKIYVVCKEIYLPREIVEILQAEERAIELYVTKEIMYIDYNISKLKEEKGMKLEVKPIKEILK